MLKMVAAPFKIVFDEDLYVVFDEDLYVILMYFLLCFKYVLVSAQRLSKSGFLLSNSPHNHWPCDKNKHKFS